MAWTMQVHHECVGTIVDDLGREHPINCTLEYGVADSYAIKLTFSTARRSVPWTFARELLDEALYAPTGTGDVHLWPTLATDGRAMTAVELANASDVALILVPSRDISFFLDASYRTVPPGEEKLYGDVDAALRELLAEKG